MALFGLELRDEKLGQSLGNGFVTRLEQHAFMPDIPFFRGEPRNRLYEYYLDGAAEIVVEFVQSGCEDYTYGVKLNRLVGIPVHEVTVIWQKDEGGLTSRFAKRCNPC